MVLVVRLSVRLRVKMVAARVTMVAKIVKVTAMRVRAIVQMVVAAHS